MVSLIPPVPQDKLRLFFFSFFMFFLIFNFYLLYLYNIPNHFYEDDKVIYFIALDLTCASNNVIVDIYMNTQIITKYKVLKNIFAKSELNLNIFYLTN